MRIYQRFVSVFIPVSGAFVAAVALVFFFYVLPVTSRSIEQNIFAELDANTCKLLWQFRLNDDDAAPDADELEQFTDGIKIGKTGYLALLDEDGDFIPDRGRGRAEFLQLSLLIMERNGGTAGFRTGGVSYRVFYRPIPEINYRIVAFVRESELCAHLFVTGAVLALCLVLAAAAFFFFTGKLRAHYDRVFEKLNSFAEKIASGSLHERLDIRPGGDSAVAGSTGPGDNGGGADEFDAFSANMNIMAENMEKMALEPGRDFLSRMSHEIRTPVAAIVGMAAIAEKSDDMAKIRNCLAKIKDGSAHLIGIINDILDFSKLEAGKLLLNEEAFILSEDMEFIDSMFRERTAEKNIDFKVTVSGIRHDCLIADKLRLNQVLINLLSNAVKFTPQNGSIGVTVEEVFYQEGEGMYRFAVSDTGIGIEPQQAKKLFTPFTQANEKISSAYGGTGLGLVISKNIVQLMAGDIEIDTWPGKGTTFSFTIKVKSGTGDAARRNQEQDAVPDFSGKRLLIVDDIDINREICLELFRETGAEMETAADGLEAFEKYFSNAENYYDMILMDMRMPVLDGCEATKKIRNCGRKDAGTVFIVAMTANVLEEEIKQAHGAGMNAHIAKPINIADAFRVIKNLFGHGKEGVL